MCLTLPSPPLHMHARTPQAHGAESDRREQLLFRTARARAAAGPAGYDTALLRAEYSNTAAISSIAAPYVLLLLDGHVRGGGMGVAVPTTFRVATVCMPPPHTHDRGSPLSLAVTWKLLRRASGQLPSCAAATVAANGPAAAVMPHVACPRASTPATAS